ncbi:unnamed protein product, partial [Polarella glacialis]
RRSSLGGMAPAASLDEIKRREAEAEKKVDTNYTGGHQSGMAVEQPPTDKEQWDRMQQLASNGSSGPLPADHRRVTVYRNGFTVDDGVFRPLSDPLNKKFMDEMSAGRCPAELQEESAEPVHVAVHDKRGEDFQEPPTPAYVKFSGEGNSLGGSSSSAAVTVQADAGSIT